MAGAGPFCERDLGDGRRCAGRVLPDPGADACLRHADPAGRARFYQSVRDSTADPWDGHLANLTFDAELFRDVRQLRDAAGILDRPLDVEIGTVAGARPSSVGLPDDLDSMPGFTLTGTLFAGRYRVTRKLGGGGMADVYLA